LLPAIYRIRDAAQGEPLRALLAIIQQELQVVESDIDTLYDNWFIETCQDWVVPYIGDLLDVQELDAGSPLTGIAEADREGAYGQQQRRAYVANTLAYRRRKGTLPILEQLTQDVTGWRSRAVEFGRLVSTTQNLDQIHLHNTTVDLRENERLEQVGTPFEQQAAYTVDIRPASRGGRYNLPNVGLFVWRLQSYPQQRVQARAVIGPESRVTGRYYTFNPVGPESVPLFNQPQTKANITTLSAEINVPAILRRPVLADELTCRRQLRSQGELPQGVRYFDADPVLTIFLNGQPRSLPPEAIVITDLSETPVSETAAASPQPDQVPWRRESAALWTDRDRQTPVLPPASLVAVDPELGRLVVHPGLDVSQVEVSYFSGFSGDVGGGAYNRVESLPIELALSQLPISPWHWSVGQAHSAVPNPLAPAIDAWNRTVMSRDGLRQKTHLPVAIVRVPGLQVVKERDTENETLPVFKPGRLQGLTVELGLCPDTVEIRPGLAVDRDGRPLRLRLSWCLNVVDRFDDVIPQLPNRTGVLVMYYTPVERGNPVDVALVPETYLDGYPSGTVMPLQILEFDGQGHLARLRPLTRAPIFQAGILQGLEVFTRPGTLETFIKPGVVVDHAGQGLVLEANYPVDLSDYMGRSVRILAVPSAPRDQQLQVVPMGDAYEPARPYIQLARFAIDSLTLTPEHIETAADRIGLSAMVSDPLATQLMSSQGGATAPATAPTAQAVIRTGLDVTPSGDGVQVTAGTVQLPGDDPFILASAQRIDLKPYAGRTLLLFVSHQPDQGWRWGLARPASKTPESDYLGIVPIAPPAIDDTTDPLALQQVDTGWIAIQDSATYRGDLTIAVPPNAHLHIVAAAGDRPHIQGDLSLQGGFEPTLAPAEVTLNGLLLEGCLQVLPGRLGKLTLQHCTLLPQAGGLRVCGQDAAAPQGDDGEFSLLAFLVSCLLTLWQLIGRDLGLNPRMPPTTMAQFLQATWQQLVMGIIEHDASDGTPERTGPAGDMPCLDGDNDQLIISLERTLSGPLYLADTVPQLHLHDCVIDKGQAENSSAVAIAAAGTAIAMHTTTVLGRTAARQLDASDCLFTEKVTVWRRQTGCIRFSYVPVASQTPQRYRCQPDLALKAALDEIPSGVTALGVIGGADSVLAADRSTAEQEESATVATDYLLAATASNGILGLSSSSEPGQPGSFWQDITGDLSDRALSALVTYRWPLSAATSVSSRPTELLVGTATGAIFRLINPPSSQLIPSSGSSESDSRRGPTDNNQNAERATWRSRPLPNVNAAITCLYPDQVAGTGHVRLTALPASAETRRAIAATGRHTRFSEELQVGDVIVIADVSWRVEQIGRPSGNQTITLDGRTAVLTGTSSTVDLAVGNTITIRLAERSGDRSQTVGQSRTITRLTLSESEPRLTLNAPFTAPLQPNTPYPFVLNADQTLTVSPAFPESETPASSQNTDFQPFEILRLWATTDGNGVWRGSIDGQSWQAWNTGLTDGRLTTVVPDAAAHLWVGTVGGSTFKLTATATGDRWVAVNQGRLPGPVNQLILSSADQLLAATDTGVYRYDPQRERWHAASTGLTVAEIVRLASYSVTSTVTIEQQEVTGDHTFFQAQGLQPGDPFSLGNQSAEIQAVHSNTQLTLKTDFPSPVAGATPYRTYDLAIAGSRDGKLFRSVDGGQTWHPLGLDLQGTDVTALISTGRNGDLWVGTAVGDILRSSNHGESWQSVQAGRSNLITKLQVLNQVQPIFTSTRYGDPGYAQLSEGCPAAIRTGAENGAEFGVFNYLRHPQQAANLTASLDEYLRFGLATGIFYMT
jgi:hypothetical protein